MYLFPLKIVELLNFITNCSNLTFTSLIRITFLLTWYTWLTVSFHWLRQLRGIRKSVDDGSAATLVHAFVTSRVDYCNAVYAGAPKTITDKLQRVLNAAARVVSDIRKFDRGLTSLLHDELHWLDVPERVTYKMGVMMYGCLHGQAPRYVADHLITSSDVASRLRLYVPQTDTSSSYLAVDLTHTAVGRFRSLIRRNKSTFYLLTYLQ